MAAVPNSSGCLVSFFSVTYDRKVGISAPPAGMAPNGKPIAVPRSHGLQDRASPSLAHPGRADRDDLGRGAAQVRGDPQRLADGEQADRDDDDVDAVGKLRHAEGQPLLTRWWVDADQADRKPDRQRGEAADPRRAEHRGDGDEGQHHHREVVRRADLDRQLTTTGASNARQSVPIVPATNDPIAAVASAWAPRPSFGPSCCPRSR